MPYYDYGKPVTKHFHQGFPGHEIAKSPAHALSSITKSNLKSYAYK